MTQQLSKDALPNTFRKYMSVAECRATLDALCVRHFVSYAGFAPGNGCAIETRAGSYVFGPKGLVRFDLARGGTLVFEG